MPATAEVAAIAVVATSHFLAAERRYAVNLGGPDRGQDRECRKFIWALSSSHFFRFIPVLFDEIGQFGIPSKWMFSFCIGTRSSISKWCPDPRACFHPMIVCSCNVFSDHDVRNAVSAAKPPRTPGQVYGCLGCSAQCGRCARTIKKIMDEALGACAKSCCSGCPHSALHAEVDPHVHSTPIAIVAAA